jgi:peptidoglycan hydrolase-like protein with peptidoglycan-binding domain
MARRWPAVLVSLLLVLAVGVLAADPMPLNATHAAGVRQQRPILRYGDRGPAVRTAQTLLSRHGYRVPVTGFFGPITRRQVRRFQAARRIRTTGNVGPLTWAALDPRPPRTTVPQTTILPTGPSSSGGRPILMYGSRGRWVRTAQDLLCRRGYTVPVTGVFGPITLGQVRRFQAARRIRTTGNVGPLTWAALVGGGPSPPNSDPSPTLRPGSQGPAVRTAQRLLSRHGYPLPATGFYGLGTHTAVWRFQ